MRSGSKLHHTMKVPEPPAIVSSPRKPFDLRENDFTNQGATLMGVGSKKSFFENFRANH